MVENQYVFLMIATNEEGKKTWKLIHVSNYYRK